MTMNRRWIRWGGRGAALALALLGLLAASGAEPRFCTTTNTHLYLQPEDGAQTCGLVELAVPATVLKEQGGYAQVRLEGWQLKDVPRILYAFEGVRIRDAILDDCAQQRIQVVKTVTDPDTGQVWNKVRLEGFWLPKKDLAQDLTKDWDQAEALYKQNCSVCHALHDPGEYTANQWPQVLKSMTPRTALDKTQVAWVTKYLQYHAKGIDPTQQPLPCCPSRSSGASAQASPGSR